MPSLTLHLGHSPLQKIIPETTHLPCNRITHQYRRVSLHTVYLNADWSVAVTVVKLVPVSTASSA